MSERSRDPEALRDEVFTRVFDEHWSAVRRHIECVVEDDEEVTALVAEVFLFAWSRLKPSRPMGRVWLLRAAERRLRARSGPTRTLRTALDAVHTGMTGDPAPAGRVGQAEVVRAMGVLTLRERRIIMLTYWDGLAVGEIAELIRASESRVRKTLGRAQDRLRMELGLEGVTPGDD